MKAKGEREKARTALSLWKKLQGFTTISLHASIVHSVEQLNNQETLKSDVPDAMHGRGSLYIYI